ncbi:S-protein homolog 74 [Linum perenne]
MMSPIAILAFSLAFAMVIFGVIPVSADNIAPSPSSLDIQDSVAPSSSEVAASPVDSKDQTRLEIHIHIVNEVTDGKELTVHCMCKTNDMGVHKVSVGSEYQWSFKTSKSGNAPFECNVRKGLTGVLLFKAYAEDPEMTRRVNNGNCYWIAKDDGIYLRQFWKNTDVFFHAWP